MTALVPIALVAWIFVAILFFAVMPPRRAVLAAFIGAWLFLPQGAIDISGFPDLDKITATTLGALLGVLIFDAGRLTSFRPSWVDLPMAIFCLTSLPSALANDLGWYDGISGVQQDIFVWGLPYFIGRIYFNDLASLRELAIAIFIGGLVYVPLCLFEIRMSPQLHYLLYGYHPSPFMMTLRFGGYRPMVFMQHGLMLGMWMTSAAIVGVWLWRCGSLQKIRNIPMWAAVLMVIVTAVLCKSSGALALLALGLLVLFANKYVRSPALLVAVVMMAPVYMYVRATGMWSGSQLVDAAYLLEEERAISLAGRLETEDILVAKASKKPWFGWGGWGRWRVYDEWTKEDITRSDGMWLIVRGERGLVGLFAITAAILLPFLLLLRRVPARQWAIAPAAAPVALAVLLLLYAIDNLFNAMVNPIYILSAGGLSGFYVAFPQLRAMALRTRAASGVGSPRQAPLAAAGA